MKSLLPLLMIMVSKITESNSVDINHLRDVLLPESVSGCRKQADVVFVLDASSSIWGPDFRKQLEFVNSIIKDLHVHTLTVKCGLVTYGDKVRVEFGLKTYSRQDAMTEAVSRVTQLRGNTRTDLALRALKMIMREDGRKNVTQIGIILTDGQSDYPNVTRLEAELVRREGIVLLAVGIGRDADHKELMDIASRNEYAFRLSSQDELQFIETLVSAIICQVDKETEDGGQDVKYQPLEVCPVDLTFLWDKSNLFSSENFILSQNFIKDVVSLLPVSEGETHVALVTFNNAPQLHFDLDKYFTVSELHEAISRIGLRNTATDMTEALRLLDSARRRYRGGVARVAVVLTGSSSRDPASAVEEAAFVKDEGTTVFAVGVGSQLNQLELESIASKPSDHFVFVVDSYEDLASIRWNLTWAICNSPPVSRRPTFPTFTAYPATTTTQTVISSVSETNKVTSSATTTTVSTATSSSTSTTLPTRSTSTTTSTASSSLASSKTRTTLSNRNPYECYGEQLNGNIVFSIPSAISSSETDNSLEFIAKMADRLDLGGDRIRMGVTPRLCLAGMPGFTLDLGSQKDQLLQILSKQLTNSSVDDTAYHLRYISEVSFGESSSASAVKVAVVIYDNRLVRPTSDLFREVNYLVDEGVVVIGVFIGQENGLSGQQLTSCSYCWLDVNTYEDLADVYVTEQLTKLITERILCRIKVDPN